MKITDRDEPATQAVLDAVLRRLLVLEGRCDDLTEVVLQSGRAVEEISAHAQALTDEVNRGFAAVGDELMMSHALNRRIAQLTDAVAEHLAFIDPAAREASPPSVA